MVRASNSVVRVFTPLLRLFLPLVILHYHLVSPECHYCDLFQIPGIQPRSLTHLQTKKKQLKLVCIFLKLIKNSSSLNKGNHDCDIVCISDLDQHRFFYFISLFSSQFYFRLRRYVSNTKDSVFKHWLKPQFQIPQSLSKILHFALYFQLSSRCLDMWSNTVFHG